MQVSSSYKKCAACSTVNIDKDICEKCGEILSYKKKLELKRKKMQEDQVAYEKEQLENPNFVERMKKHKYFLVRFIGYILYSIFLVVSAIGLGLAWFISMIAAG